MNSSLDLKNETNGIEKSTKTKSKKPIKLETSIVKSKSTSHVNSLNLNDKVKPLLATSTTVVTPLKQTKLDSFFGKASQSKKSIEKNKPEDESSQEKKKSSEIEKKKSLSPSDSIVSPASSNYLSAKTSRRTSSDLNYEFKSTENIEEAKNDSKLEDDEEDGHFHSLNNIADSTMLETSKTINDSTKLEFLNVSTLNYSNDQNVNENVNNTTTPLLPPPAIPPPVTTTPAILNSTCSSIKAECCESSTENSFCSETNTSKEIIENNEKAFLNSTPAIKKNLNVSTSSSEDEEDEPKEKVLIIPETTTYNKNKPTTEKNYYVAPSSTPSTVTTSSYFNPSYYPPGQEVYQTPLYPQQYQQPHYNQDFYSSQPGYYQNYNQQSNSYVNTNHYTPQQQQAYAYQQQNFAYNNQNPGTLVQQPKMASYPAYPHNSGFLQYPNQNTFYNSYPPQAASPKMQPTSYFNNNNNINQQDTSSTNSMTYATLSTIHTPALPLQQQQTSQTYATFSNYNSQQHNATTIPYPSSIYGATNMGSPTY